MFDIKWIRENPEAYDRAMESRGAEPAAAALIALDTERREAQTRAQEIQSNRNKLAKEIGVAKARGEDASEIIAEVSRSKQQEAEAEEAAKKAAADLDEALAALPNLPAGDVPVGADESANLEIRKWGEPKDLGFEAKEHFEIGEGLGLMDFEAAAKISGARFVVLSGALARLERAIATFMLDLQTLEHGYTEVSPPILVRDEALFGTGQLPKFGEDSFRTTDGLWLIATAEVSLTNLVAGEILAEADLPKRVTALTPCFR